MIVFVRRMKDMGAAKDRTGNLTSGNIWSITNFAKECELTRFSLVVVKAPGER